MVHNPGCREAPTAFAITERINSTQSGEGLTRLAQAHDACDGQIFHTTIQQVVTTTDGAVIGWSLRRWLDPARKIARSEYRIGPRAQPGTRWRRSTTHPDGR